MQAGRPVWLKVSGAANTGFEFHTFSRWPLINQPGCAARMQHAIIHRGTENLSLRGTIGCTPHFEKNKLCSPHYRLSILSQVIKLHRTVHSPKMSPKHCKDETVGKWRQRIADIGLPRELPIMVNGHEVRTRKNNKTAMKGRFYPRNDLKEILTQEVIEDILNHDCPTYCDQQRGIIEKLDEDGPWADEKPRLASNKNPELSRVWAEQICGTDGSSGAVTIFGLLVVIRRPLLIVGFLDRNVTDQGFEQICDHLVDGPGIFDYWRHFHEREKALSEKAAETFRKQMWSFVPPKISVNVTKIITQSFRRERILPFIEMPQLMGRGGYSSVYKVRLHEDYFAVPAEFKVSSWFISNIYLLKVAKSLLFQVRHQL